MPMNLLEQNRQEVTERAIACYDRAAVKDPLVKEVWNHRKKVNGSYTLIMSSFATYFDCYMNEVMLPLDKEWVVRNRITTDLFHDPSEDKIIAAMIDYCRRNAKNKDVLPLNQFIYNEGNQTSAFIRTLAGLERGESYDEVFGEMSPFVRELYDTLECRYNVSFGDKIVRLLNWYKKNCTRIHNGNPGTVNLSPLRHYNHFMESLMRYAIDSDDWSVLHINSPAWVIWSSMIHESYSVDIDCEDLGGSLVPPEYEIKMVAPGSLLNPLL